MKYVSTRICSQCPNKSFYGANSYICFDILGIKLYVNKIATEDRESDILVIGKG